MVAGLPAVREIQCCRSRQVAFGHSKPHDPGQRWEDDLAEGEENEQGRPEANHVAVRTVARATEPGRSLRGSCQAEGALGRMKLVTFHGERVAASLTKPAPRDLRIPTAQGR